MSEKFDELNDVFKQPNKAMQEISKRIQLSQDLIKEKFQDIKLPEIKVPDIQDRIVSLNLPTQADFNHHREKEEREEKYKSDVLKALQKIEKNTGGIVEIVNLVRENNDKQDQIIELLQEIISISAVKTKQEADSKFKNVMTKIQDLGGSVESVQTLYGLLNTVYNSVNSVL